MEQSTFRVTVCILYVTTGLRGKQALVWHSKNECICSQKRELLTYWVNCSLVPGALFLTRPNGVSSHDLDPCIDVTEDGRKQTVPCCSPIYNTSLAITQSTSQSCCNTGPLFEENGQHRSRLKRAIHHPRPLVLLTAFSPQHQGSVLCPSQTHAFTEDYTTSTYFSCFLISTDRGKSSLHTGLISSYLETISHEIAPSAISASSALPFTMNVSSFFIRIHVHTQPCVSPVVWCCHHIYMFTCVAYYDLNQAYKAVFHGDDTLQPNLTNGDVQLAAKSSWLHFSALPLLSLHFSPTGSQRGDMFT